MKKKIYICLLIIIFLFIVGTRTTSQGDYTLDSNNTNPTIIQVAGSLGKHTLILKSDGTVWAFGQNSYGQCGNGQTNEYVNLTKVEGLNDITKIAVGYYHSLALKSDGTVYAWGNNSNRQLGDGSTINKTSPVLVQTVENDEEIALTGVTDIAAGYAHSLALKSDGTVWAWGANSSGQLGDGTIYPRLTATKVKDITEAVSISAGYHHSIALKQDGTVWLWGVNNYGQLGNGLSDNSNIPVIAMKNDETELTDITSVSALYFHTLALDKNGNVWAWGANYYYQLGTGNKTNLSFATQIQNFSDVTAISAGYYHSMALKGDGSVWTWGRNNVGQLGNQISGNEKSTPIQGVNLSNVVSISAAYDYCLAVTEDGNAWGWGLNDYGQLGDGTRTNATEPVNIITQPQSTISPSTKIVVTVNDLRNITDVQEGDYVHTNGYYQSGDGGDAVYLITNSTETEDNGSVIALNSGLCAKLVVDTTNIVVNVKQFGAVADDITDNIPAINNALAFLKSKNPDTPKTLIFPQGTYYVKAGTNLIECTPIKNLTISGYMATIMLHPESTQFDAVMDVSGDRLTIEGLTFNNNVNQTPNIRPISSVKKQNPDKEPGNERMIRFNSMYKDVTLRDLTFYSSGVNAIRFKAIRGLIENCKIYYVTTDNPLPEDLDDNGKIAWFDVSSIYVTGKYVTLRNLSFDVLCTNFLPHTAIETHASNVNVEHSIITGYNHGIIISDMDNSETNDCFTDILVTDNKINIVSEGIIMWPVYDMRTYRDGEYNNKGTISRITIARNEITTKQNGISVLVQTTEDYQEDMISPIGIKNIIDGIVIDTNVFRYVGNRNDYDSYSNMAVNVFNNGSAAINMIVKHYNTKNIIVQNNKIYDFPAYAMKFGARSNASGEANAENITVQDNLITNCGYNYEFYNNLVVQIATITTRGVRNADISENHFVYNLEDNKPLIPIGLPMPRSASDVEKMRYVGNIFEGYPDMSYYYRNSLDYPKDKYDFGTSKNNGIQINPTETYRLMTGDIFNLNDQKYLCLDSVYITPEPVVATVIEVMYANYAYKVSDVSKFKIGDRIIRDGVSTPRACYIQNIILNPTEEYPNAGIVVGLLPANGLSGNAPFDGGYTVGSKIKLDTGIRETEQATALRANVIILDELEISSPVYIIDNEDFIKNISPNTSVEELLNNIISNYEIEVYNKQGQKIEGQNIVGTGMTIKAVETGEEYALIVKGDITGDGKITVTDLSKLKAHLVGLGTLEGVSLKAADVNLNEQVTITDLSILKQMLVGALQ